MAFNSFKVLKLWQFFGNFLSFAKTTGSILRLCSIKKSGFGNFLRLNCYNLLFAKNMNSGKSFDRFSELLTVFQTFSKKSFLKYYAIKSEIKNSSKGNSCENYSCRSSDSSMFCMRKVISLGKLISQIFLLLKSLIFEIVQFLKSHFSCRISIANFVNIKNVILVLMGT